MTSSLLFLALLSPALVATLAGLETASLELNAHLRVQPAHCVYDFYFLSDFSTMPYRRPYKRARYAKRTSTLFSRRLLSFKQQMKLQLQRLRSFLGQMLRGCVRSSI